MEQEREIVLIFEIEIWGSDGNVAQMVERGIVPFRVTPDVVGSSPTVASE